jgi:hypothetical protein
MKKRCRYCQVYLNILQSILSIFRSDIEGNNLLSTKLNISSFYIHFPNFWSRLLNLVGCIPLFRPSSSADENLHPAYRAAEERGRSGQDCRTFYPKCPVGLLDVIAPFAEWHFGTNQSPKRMREMYQQYTMQLTNNDDKVAWHQSSCNWTRTITRLRI